MPLHFPSPHGQIFLHISILIGIILCVVLLTLSAFFESEIGVPQEIHLLLQVQVGYLLDIFIYWGSGTVTNCCLFPYLRIAFLSNTMASSCSSTFVGRQHWVSASHQTPKLWMGWGKSPWKHPTLLLLLTLSHRCTCAFRSDA